MLRTILLWCCVSLCGVMLVANADTLTPVGTWQTMDDATGQPRNIVKIYPTDNNELQGQIEKVFYRSGEGPDDVCKKCTGEFHNQRILGMTILWGMVQKDANEWVDGNILDPENGKIYRCKLMLRADGERMAVRYFIVIPFIGRTQTWIRTA